MRVRARARARARVGVGVRVRVRVRVGVRVRADPVEDPIEERCLRSRVGVAAVSSAERRDEHAARSS